MEKLSFYLKIILIILIGIVFIINPKFSGNAILEIFSFNVNISHILIIFLIMGLIMIFSLDQMLTVNARIQSGEYHNIPYKFYRAPNSQKIVLIAPGMGPRELDSNTTIKGLAEKLARKGVSSIVFGIQQGENVPSPKTVTKDYLRMAKLAKNLGFENVHGIYGSSLSAGPALVAAGRLGIRHIALRSPLVYFNEIFNHAVSSRGGKPETAREGWKKAGRMQKGENSLPYDLYEQFEKADVDKITSRLKGANIEITHGTADELVPFQYANKAYERLKSAGVDVRFDVIDNAKHDYDAKHQRYALRRLAKVLS